MNPKVVVFKVTGADGQDYKWRFQHIPRVYSTLGRHMAGWLLTSHDGCERFSEGNWLAFVPFVHLVASNYGFTTRLS